MGSSGTYDATCTLWAINKYCSPYHHTGDSSTVEGCFAQSQSTAACYNYGATAGYVSKYKGSSSSDNCYCGTTANECSDPSGFGDASTYEVRPHLHCSHSPVSTQGAALRRRCGIAA